MQKNVKFFVRKGGLSHHAYFFTPKRGKIYGFAVGNFNFASAPALNSEHLRVVALAYDYNRIAEFGIFFNDFLRAADRSEERR